MAASRSNRSRRITSLAFCTLLVACASQPSVPPAAPISSAAPATDDQGPRLPHGAFPHGVPTDLSRDWYPSEARQRGLTGRVIVEFRIGANGRPQDVKIHRADADPILQSAAVQMARTFKYDVKDPTFNPTDSSVYRESISFQLIGCGMARVPPYPGYDNVMVVSGGCQKR
jgi:TonB family protein